MRAKEFLASSTLLEMFAKPSYLIKTANRAEVKAGMEFEMYIPDPHYDEFENFESEPNYEEDRSADSIDDVLNFFDDGDWNSSREITR